uniref:F-box domain-containing protein n=1 Tax=Steinernema glaseri TaxID=37863 RepID=A0A1I7ZDT9_9BILA
MDKVPALFINSVLSVSRLSIMKEVLELSSHSWNRLAAKQLKQRKDWTLCFFQRGKEYFGYLEKYQKSLMEFVSFQEFAKTDPTLNQITGIWFDGPFRLPYGEEITSKSTKITSKQDVKRLERLFFSRINYDALYVLKMDTTDNLGLHSAILHHLVDKKIEIPQLYLKYDNPDSTELLKRLVQTKGITDMTMHGEWPQESTVPLIEAVVLQRQLRDICCAATINVSESFFTSLVEEWRNDSSPEDKQVIFRGIKTEPPFACVVHHHPNLKDRLEVTAANNSITIKTTLKMWL